MKQYIGIGEYNKNFKYILLSGIFSILSDFLFGTENDAFGVVKFFTNNIQNKLYLHITVHEIVRYLGLTIILIIISIYKMKKKSKKNDINENAINKNMNPIKLIYNDGEKKVQESISFTSIIFTMLIWIIQFYLTKLFYRSSFRELDYWIIELLIVTFINFKMFKINIYSHQKCAIIYNTCFCTLLKIIVVIILISCDGFGENNLYKQNVYLFPVGFIIYIFIVILRGYSISKIKYYMDLKYISSIKILLFSSIIGIFFFSSICVIETFIECSFLKNIEICTVSDDNKSFYIDNFLIYFRTLKKAHYTEIIYEIILSFFGIISYFFYLYFYLLILEYLTPVHYVFSNAIYFFLIQPIFLLHHKVTTGNYFSGPEESTNYKYTQFQLNFISNFGAIFGFLVYLEFIELKCCGLNYNIKKSIRQRSIEDLVQNETLIDENQDKNQKDNLDYGNQQNINSIELENKNFD